MTPVAIFWWETKSGLCQKRCIFGRPDRQHTAAMLCRARRQTHRSYAIACTQTNTPQLCYCVHADKHTAAMLWRARRKHTAAMLWRARRQTHRSYAMACTQTNTPQPCYAVPSNWVLVTAGQCMAGERARRQTHCCPR